MVSPLWINLFLLHSVCIQTHYTWYISLPSIPLHLPNISVSPCFNKWEGWSGNDPMMNISKEANSCRGMDELMEVRSFWRIRKYIMNEKNDGTRSAGGKKHEKEKKLVILRQNKTCSYSICMEIACVNWFLSFLPPFLKDAPSFFMLFSHSMTKTGQNGVVGMRQQKRRNRIKRQFYVCLTDDCKQCHF